MPSGIKHPSSWTDIANIALGRLGDAQISNLLQPRNDNAMYCRRFMGQAVDDVYTEHPWKQATKRVQLARLAEAPAFGFAYAYQLPNDWVPCQDDEDEEERSNIDTGGYDYSIEGDQLLTDAETIYMAYIARPAEFGNIPIFLRRPIALALAFLLTTPLTSSEALASRVAAEYGAAIKTAKRIDARMRLQVKSKPGDESRPTWWADER